MNISSDTIVWDTIAPSPLATTLPPLLPSLGSDPTIAPSPLATTLPPSLPSLGSDPTIAPSESPTLIPSSSAPTTLLSTRKLLAYASCLLPYGIVFDIHDDLYIAAEQGFYRRRALEPALDIIAANASFHGITIDTTMSMLFLTNYHEKAIDAYNVTSGSYGTIYRFVGLEAAVHPINIAVDGDANLYVSLDDRRLSAILRIDAASHELSEFLPQHRFFVGGLSIDHRLQLLYASDLSSQQIYRINLTDSSIALFAGNGMEEVYGVGAYTGDGGLAINAAFFSPHGFAVAEDGSIFIADTGNAVVRYIDSSSGIVSLYAGSPSKQGYNGDGLSADQAMLRYPNALALDSHGFLYIADTKNDLVRGVYPYDQAPTIAPSNQPSAPPSSAPTTSMPSIEPSMLPSALPSTLPSAIPTSTTTMPTLQPTISLQPSAMPTPNATTPVIQPSTATAQTAQASSWMTWMIALLLGGGLLAAMGYYLYYNTEVITGKKKPSYRQVEMIDQFDDAFTEDEIEGV